jgi:hypothetical protein
MPIIWELNVGDLFRIDASWYRFTAIDGENAVLHVIGVKGSSERMPLTTEVSEVSVLSKK